MRHDLHMALARQLVLKSGPYYAKALYSFTFVPVPQEGSTMFLTPGLVLGYDPTWAEHASDDELAADLVHELHHLLSGHGERIAALADPRLGNLAGDLAINPPIRDAGWSLAKDGPYAAVFPEQLGLPHGKTLEEYYLLLQAQGRGGRPPAASPGPPRVGQGQCGGIAGHPRDPAQEQALDQVFGRGALETKLIVQQVERDVREHARTHGVGTLPGQLHHLLDVPKGPPKVPWQRVLARHLRAAAGQLQHGGDEPSRLRPARRSFTLGLVRPGFVDHVPELAVVLDTSASMSTRQLQDSLRESMGLVRRLGVSELWFCEADAAVSLTWRRVRSSFFHKVPIHGRGGTDFRPALASAQKLRPFPPLLLYFTDGEGTAPEHPPAGRQEVIWALVKHPSASYAPPVPAPWGRAVFIDPSQESDPHGPVLPHRQPGQAPVPRPARVRRRHEIARVRNVLERHPDRPCRPSRERQRPGGR